jgi:EAL and modified HD-GYP domain-containing signal transduction protein
MDILVARQPVFDRYQQVRAYDLLLKTSFENLYNDPNWEKANTAALAMNLLSSHIATISAGKNVFVNFDGRMLQRDMATIFPEDDVAIEIIYEGKSDAELLRQCARLKERGYQIVVDSTVPELPPAELLDLIDILKVDAGGIEKLKKENNRTRSNRLKLLAKNLSGRADFNEAVERGYTYFQGDFYRKSQWRQPGDVPYAKLNLLLLLHEINSPGVSFQNISRIVQRDVGLSYKLMRHINSAYFGFPSEIRSVKYALTLLGLLNIRQWLSNVALLELAQDKPDELVVNSMVRARFAELLASRFGLAKRSSELLLLGLFSLLDVFLERPMEIVLEKLPLTDELKSALLHQNSPFLPVYQLVLAYEGGDWNSVSRIAKEEVIAESELSLLYIKALEWSRQVFVD